MLSRSLAALTLIAAVLGCDDSTNPVSPGAVFDAAINAPASARTGVSSETIYGLTGFNTLIVFSSGKPNQTAAGIAISGLAAGETVIGIDFRPSDLNMDAVNDVGKLYGVTDASRIYVIDPATGAASSPVTLSAGISGRAIGIGFNPVPDRLRIHTTSGQNLRVNVDNGVAIVDGVLTYGAGDSNSGANPAIVATGYTNNDNNPATGTALFALDAATDALVTFPAGTGVRTAASWPQSARLESMPASRRDSISALRRVLPTPW